MRIVALTLALVFVAAPARADDALEARKHYDRGFAAYALHKYADAATEYEKAFELKPDQAILYNAAQAWRLSGDKKRALTLYESYLHLFANQARRAEVEQLVAKLRAQIADDEAAQPKPAPEVTPAPTVMPVVTPPASPPATTATEALTAPAPKKKPFTKTPAFYAIIGVSAAVVVAGITVGVVLGTAKTTYPTAGGMVAF